MPKPSKGGQKGIPKAQPQQKQSKQPKNNEVTLKEQLGKKRQPIPISEIMSNNKDGKPRLNPNFGSRKEYNVNCQRCVVAYELNRRGYKVEALPNEPADKNDKNQWSKNIRYFDKNNKVKYASKWRGAFRHAKTIDIKETRKVGAVAKIEQHMQSFGEGSRAIIKVKWKRKNSGHVINVENVKGRIIAFDAQTGQKKDLKEMFTRVSKGRIQLTRTDNLQISDRAKYFVRKRDK